MSLFDVIWLDELVKELWLEKLLLEVERVLEDTMPNECVPEEIGTVLEIAELWIMETTTLEETVLPTVLRREVRDVVFV